MKRKRPKFFCGHCPNRSSPYDECSKGKHHRRYHAGKAEFWTKVRDTTLLLE